MSSLLLKQISQIPIETFNRSEKISSREIKKLSKTTNLFILPMFLLRIFLASIHFILPQARIAHVKKNEFSMSFIHDTADDNMNLHRKRKG